jgi:F-box protein, helicase, 18
MQLTNEQMQIINAAGDLKINAVAGSGKTTTVTEYARTRPPQSKILYLAFNRSVKMEAAQKFAGLQLYNVTAETAHSLAYKHVVQKHGYKVRAQGYKTNEIAELLRIRMTGDKHAVYVAASHINRLVTMYCNSDRTALREVAYAAALASPKARAFAESFSNYIFKKAAELLEKMDKGEIEITHDFYLKKFQLSKPRLPYDYILFDEGQDASGAMLDVFLNQDATKVIVGDTNQQIYSWRYAVNSLERAAFSSHNLSTSFRFGSDIGALARKVLDYKKVLGRSESWKIEGAGTSKDIHTKATIARGNLGLLLRAIQYISAEKPAGPIYFEGNIHSYTYAEDGTSLYDILNLSNQRYHLIKDRVIRNMRSLGEVEEYAKATEEHQLLVMTEIVRAYGNEIPRLLKTLKEKHVERDEKHRAEMIFSTVHRSKGMEYDEVHLADDFVKEKNVEKFRDGKSETPPEKLNEEINLLYVAVTRARVRLYIPEAIVPKEYTPGDAVVVTSTAAETEAPARIEARRRAYSLSDKRSENRRAYLPWDREADEELSLLVREGMKTKEIAAHFGRTEGAVISRMKKLTGENTK